MRPAPGRIAAAVLAVLTEAVLLAVPARADERDVDGGSVSVTVRIDPLECMIGCGAGSPPAIELPATGTPSAAPALWIAGALLAAGVLLAVRARAARRDRRLAPSIPSTAYAVVNDAGISSAGCLAEEDPPMGRTIEREGGA